jgi:hypothetical protein
MFYGSIGHLSADKVAKVVNYFGVVSVGTANKIGVDGSFMSSLVSNGYVKVVGKEDSFVCVGGDMYRKVTVNVYALNIPLEDFVTRYKNSSDKYMEEKKALADYHISQAELRLAEAKAHINEAFK